MEKFLNLADKYGIQFSMSVDYISRDAIYYYIIYVRPEKVDDGTKVGRVEGHSLEDIFIKLDNRLSQLYPQTPIYDL